MPEMMTYSQLSKHLGLSVNTLYGMVHDRRIPHIRLSKRLVLFDAAEITAWLNASRNSAVCKAGTDKKSVRP